MLTRLNRTQTTAITGIAARRCASSGADEKEKNAAKTAPPAEAGAKPGVAKYTPTGSIKKQRTVKDILQGEPGYLPDSLRLLSFGFRAYAKLPRDEQDLVFWYALFLWFVYLSALLLSWWELLLPLWLTLKVRCSKNSCTPDVVPSAYHPVPLDAVKEAVFRRGRYVLLEGPKGTGKTTLLKAFSMEVTCPIFIEVKDGPSGEGSKDYVLHYVAKALSTNWNTVSMSKAQRVLKYLNWWGTPAVLIFKIESDA